MQSGRTFFRSHGCLMPILERARDLSRSFAQFLSTLSLPSWLLHDPCRRAGCQLFRTLLRLTTYSRRHEDALALCPSACRSSFVNMRVSRCHLSQNVALKRRLILDFTITYHMTGVAGDLTFGSVPLRIECASQSCGTEVVRCLRCRLSSVLQCA